MQTQTRAAAVAEENSSVPRLFAVPTLIMPTSPGWHCFYNSPQLYAARGEGGGGWGEDTTLLILTQTVKEKSVARISQVPAWPSLYSGTAGFKSAAADNSLTQGRAL